MVVRVFGRIDCGIEVDFQKKEGDSYMMEFPKKMDSGFYVVEVYAEDDAGNIGYCSTLLCTIDPDGACVHLVSVGYVLRPDPAGFELKMIRNPIYLEAIPPERCRGDG